MIGVHGDHRHLGQLTGFGVKPDGYVPGSLYVVIAKLRKKWLGIVRPRVFEYGRSKGAGAAALHSTAIGKKAGSPRAMLNRFTLQPTPYAVSWAVIG